MYKRLCEAEKDTLLLFLVVIFLLDLTVLVFDEYGIKPVFEELSDEHHAHQSVHDLEPEVKFQLAAVAKQGHERLLS